MCPRAATCEMVKIMQEYGEVVCCLGSALNIQNNAIFLQSDISISLDPLFPSNCWNPTEKSTHTQLHSTTPLNLSSILGSLPCSIHLCNYDNSSIIQLIKQARHTTSGIRKCFLFLLQCQLFLVMIQVLACLVQLPPPLGTTDVLCLSCIYFPLVSVSFLGKPPDSTIMNVATGKNLKFLPKRTQQFFVLYFLVKFGLTVCTYLACFGFMLRGFCMKYHSKMDYLCHPFAPFMNSTAASPNWFGEYSNALMLAQKIIAFFILINGLCTSMSHVYRSKPLWKQSPLSNYWWCTAIITAIGFHVTQSFVAYFLWSNPSPHLSFDLSDIPSETWLLGFLWLFPLMFINEFIKLHEIRMRVRYQKRQKLQFDTKLGMNSPF
nr:PREDICTED: uncharacterized protein KIAA0195-like [Latimeria chalumnae]|eukprot:XP_014344778.1 PREDICTED: uncharacterized protein KIAA0195-like [Latimeria chalumnae]